MSHSKRSRSVPIVSVLCAGLALSSGCSTTEPPLRSTPESPVEDLALDLEAQWSARAQSLEPAAGASDPVAFWSAVVDRASPAVRAARQEVAARESETRAIGLGVSPELEASYLASGNGGEPGVRETELSLALDVAGLVGAGRTGAARSRAHAQAALARAELAAARNETRRAVFAAAAELAGTRELAVRIAALEQEAAPTLARLGLFDTQGWLAPSDVATARAMAHHLDARRAALEAAAARARLDLVKSSGLSPHSPWLDDESLVRLDAFEQPAASDAAPRDAPQLLALQPTLAVARARWVVAEAELRIACAERWPALLIGPKARFTADDVLLGGLLRFELPWPGAASAAVDAASARRDEVQRTLADEYAAAVERQAAAAHARDASRTTADEHAREIDEASARRFDAASARFAVDASALNEWTMALGQREEALTAHSEARVAALRARFEYEAARGEDAP
jgi:outer membrane protein TolC